MTDAAATEGSTRRDPPWVSDDVRDHRLLLLPVPELPVLDGAGRPQVTVVVREVAGETIAEGYTSRQRLVDARGPAQPWVAFSMLDSIRLLADAGASVLVVDAGADCGTVGVDLTLAATEGGRSR